MVTYKTDVLPNLKKKPSYKARIRDRPVVQNFTEYTKNTSIHGIKYLGWKKRPHAEKIYWIIIFMICLILLGFFIREIILKWGHRFVILVEDDMPTPIHKIPFPAVTICPQYKLRKSEFSYRKFINLYIGRYTNSTAFNEYIMRYQLAQQVCSYTTVSIMNDDLFSTQDFLNKSHIELLHKITPTMADILNVQKRNRCNVKLNSLKISSNSFPINVDRFSTILTNAGACFTLNLHPDIIRNENVQTDYSYINYCTTRNESCPASDVSRIRINLITNKTDMDFLCQPSHLGYKIILHSPEIYPTTFENYIGVNHESVTQIKVQPKMITTSDTLRSYTPKQRQCYFPGERQLKFFNFYNRANCKLECFSNYTLQVYGCVHFGLPYSPGVPICGETIDYIELYEMVEGLDSLLTYLHDYPDKRDDGLVFQNSNDLYPQSCDCLSECNSIDYEYTTTVESFSFDKILKEIDIFWNSSSPEAPAELEIFWESSKFKGTIRKQLYTFSDLVSHFGGLLGLFMGASILSIFEIIYFCVIRNFTKNNYKR